MALSYSTSKSALGWNESALYEGGVEERLPALANEFSKKFLYSYCTVPKKKGGHERTTYHERTVLQLIYT